MLYTFVNKTFGVAESLSACQELSLSIHDIVKNVSIPTNCATCSSLNVFYFLALFYLFKAERTLLMHCSSRIIYLTHYSLDTLWDPPE